jgi:putative ABC transport system permease protein
VLGKTVNVGMPYRVVGVLPAGFRLLEEVDVWIPLGTSPAASADRTRRTLRAIGRLAPGAKRADAEAELGALARQLELEYPEAHAGLSTEIVPLDEVIVGPVRPALILLLGAVGFVLLVACANLATLLLSRAVARQKEIAIRTALGAGKGRIARFLLTESLMLSLAGGIVGLALGYWAVTLLPAILPSRIPRQEEIGIDARVLGFTFAAALLTGVLAALLPALQASRLDLRTSLAEARGSESPGGRRLRGLLAVSEIALTFVLVVGAGLLLRSFIRLLGVDPGFDRTHVLSLQVSSDLEEAPRRVAFFHELFDRLRALPGVQSVGASTRLPFREGGSAPVELYGRAEPGAERQEVEIRRASVDYFRTMGIRLLRGRSFTPEDHLDAPPVAVVNETAARRLWPGEDPLEKRLRVWVRGSPGPWVSVVGVVGDVRHFGLDTGARPEVYLSFDQGPPFGPLLVIRPLRTRLRWFRRCARTFAPSIRRWASSTSPRSTSWSPTRSLRAASPRFWPRVSALWPCSSP